MLSLRRDKFVSDPLKCESLFCVNKKKFSFGWMFINYRLTNTRPTVVCPEINPPAQSWADVIDPTLAAGLLCSDGNPGRPCPRLSFPWDPDAWHMVHEQILQIKTHNSPVKNVMRLEQRKAYQWRSLRHSSSADKVDVGSANSVDIIPRLLRFQAIKFFQRQTLATRMHRAGAKTVQTREKRCKHVQYNTSALQEPNLNPFHLKEIVRSGRPHLFSKKHSTLPIFTTRSKWRVGY